MMFSKAAKTGMRVCALLIAWIAALALVFAASTWLYRKASKAAVRHAEVKALIREAPAADSLLAEYRRLEGVLSTLGRGLEAGQEGSDALRILVERAKASGLLVTGLKALEERPAESYKELPFEIRAHGDFAEVQSFLQGLDSLGLLMRLHTMSLKAKALHRPDLEAVLELSLYSAGKRP